jgi:hypothetical protein
LAQSEPRRDRAVRAHLITGAGVISVPVQRLHRGEKIARQPEALVAELPCVLELLRVLSRFFGERH